MRDPRQKADQMAQVIYQDRKQAGRPITVDQARQIANKTAQRVENKKRK